jgi:hypothetical protein
MHVLVSASICSCVNARISPDICVHRQFSRSKSQNWPGAHHVLSDHHLMRHRMTTKVCKKPNYTVQYVRSPRRRSLHAVLSGKPLQDHHLQGRLAACPGGRNATPRMPQRPQAAAPTRWRAQSSCVRARFEPKVGGTGPSKLLLEQVPDPSAGHLPAVGGF